MSVNNIRYMIGANRHDLLQGLKRKRSRWDIEQLIKREHNKTTVVDFVGISHEAVVAVSPFNVSHDTIIIKKDKVIEIRVRKLPILFPYNFLEMVYRALCYTSSRDQYYVVEVVGLDDSMNEVNITTTTSIEHQEALEQALILQSWIGVDLYSEDANTRQKTLVSRRGIDPQLK